MSRPESGAALDGVAIIGMATTFSRARNIDEFWRNPAEVRTATEKLAAPALAEAARFARTARAEHV